MPLLFSKPILSLEAPNASGSLTLHSLFLRFGGWVGLSLVGLLWLLSGKPRLKPKPVFQPLKTQTVAEWKTLAKRCEALSDDSTQGLFRELDCLVSMRRTITSYSPNLEILLRQKFRELFSLVQAEMDFGVALEQWQMLYRLSAKLYISKNKDAERAEIPVYVVNSHHLALPFWIKEGLRRDVGPLFHLDTHSDMRPIPDPADVKKAIEDLRRGRNIRDAWHTIAHTIDDCAMPVAGAVLSGIYKDIVWGRPSWTLTPDFLRRNFFFALLKKPFHKDRDKLSQSSPRHPHRRHSPLATGQADWPGLNEDLWEGRFRMYSMDKPASDNRWNPVMLDWRYVPQHHKPLPRTYKHVTPFRWSVMLTDFPIQPNGRGKGRTIFQSLLKAIPKGRFTLDIDLDYFASIDASPKFRRERGKPVKTDADGFAKQRKILTARLKRFANLLHALRRVGRVPALVTIADSTKLNFALDSVTEGQSEYTPQEHTYFLHQGVRDILIQVYGKKVIPSRSRARRKRRLVSRSSKTL
ncbi:MAG: hypothetical protein EP343_26040 [Deltaproteobacteria bacterium]|nr:MAG: hypothetical protein EP343_26040 [Deltaproteobacteria bacterium]